MTLFKWSVFRKSYVQIALLMIMGFVILSIIVDNTLQATDTEYFVRIASADAQLLIGDLDAVAAQDWPDRIATYVPQFAVSVIGLMEEVPADWELVDSVGDSYFSGTWAEYWEIAYRIDDSPQYLRVRESDFDPASSDELWEFFVPLFSLFLAVGFGMYRLARRVELPLRRLSASAARLAAGDLAARVDGSYEEPFRSLVQQFNTMADRIERLAVDQRIMVGAVPHELRTPIARMRFALDLTKNTTSLPEMRTDIEQIDGYLDQLEVTVTETLDLSKLQLSPRVEFRSMDLRAMIVECVEETSAINDIPVLVDLPQDFNDTGVGNRNLLKRALINLLTNAKHHAAKRIRVASESVDNRTLELVVEDDGPGVHHNQRDNLFVPFARTDLSRSRMTGGVGLGLALVALIMHRHNGTASYQESDLGGAAFVLHWPAYESTGLSGS